MKFGEVCWSSEAILFIPCSLIHSYVDREGKGQVSGPGDKYALGVTDASSDTYHSKAGPVI